MREGTWNEFCHFLLLDYAILDHIKLFLGQSEAKLSEMISKDKMECFSELVFGGGICFVLLKGSS